MTTPADVDLAVGTGLGPRLRRLSRRLLGVTAALPEEVPRDERWWPVATTLAILVGYNVVGNILLPGAWYVPVNLGMTVLLLALARRAGISWDELGLARQHLRSGLVVGLALFGIIAVVYALGVLAPFSRDAFRDERAVSGGLGWLLFTTLVRVPVGTVLFEEVAFRGVLLAQGRRRFGTAGGVLASSSVFGLWHVLPGVESATANAAIAAFADTTPGFAAAIAGTVMSTFVAGWIFCLLRLRTGSLLAPILLHLATNSLGFVAAYTVLRLL